MPQRVTLALKKLMSPSGLFCLPHEVRQGKEQALWAEHTDLSLSLTYSQAWGLASLAMPPCGGGMSYVALPVLWRGWGRGWGQVPSTSGGGPLPSVQPRPPLFLPASVSSSSRQSGVGVCHLTITGQPGRVGTFMSCFLAMGTRLAANRG